MAELRSFLVGVVIAGALLLVVGVVFGLFGGDDGGAPSVRLLGTPPATRTPPPAVTRSPDEFTPVATVAAPQTPAEGSPSPGETLSPQGSPVSADTPSVVDTPLPEATPEPTLEIAPTAAPTSPPSQLAEAQEYAASIGQYAPDLVGQLTYLAGNAGAPSIASPEWRSFTLESAQAVQGLSAAISGVAAPFCLSETHASILASAGQASSAAAAVIAAINSNSPNDASAQVGTLIGARDNIDSASLSISAIIGEC